LQYIIFLYNSSVEVSLIGSRSWRWKNADAFWGPAKEQHIHICGIYSTQITK